MSDILVESLYEFWNSVQVQTISTVDVRDTRGGESTYYNSGMCLLRGENEWIRPIVCHLYSCSRKIG